MILPLPRHTRFGAKLPCPARLVWSVRFTLVDTFLPVVKCRDADSELSAELGDGQIRGLLSSELAAPPLAPSSRLMGCVNAGMMFLPKPRPTRFGARRPGLAMILPLPRHTRFGAKLPCPARLVGSGAYSYTPNLEQLKLDIDRIARL